jgi:DedD protein
MNPEVEMPTATSEDTEITLGTGKMLALFFGLVVLCAVFFGVGFSLGKESVLKPSAAEITPQPASTPILRPVSVKTTTAPAPDKPADSQPASDSAPAAEASAPATASAPDPAAPPVLNGYFVQVAAVTKQEDADALVDALKNKQYPAFSANAPADKLFHVQCGPYADIKDAEALRAKLISDGYNPILKK